MTTRTFEFRRHSIKDGPNGVVIGPRGYALARLIGARELRGRGFDGFFVSAYWRTVQTMSAFAEGAEDFALKLQPEIAPIYLAWPELKPLWRACREAELRGEDLLQAALRHDETLTRRAAKTVADRFKQWACSLDDGKNCLIVGHSPYLELIVLGMYGLEMPSLKECQGFRIVFDGRIFELETGMLGADQDARRVGLFP